MRRETEQSQNPQQEPLQAWVANEQLPTAVMVAEVEEPEPAQKKGGEKKRWQRTKECW